MKTSKRATQCSEMSEALSRYSKVRSVIEGSSNQSAFSSVVNDESIEDECIVKAVI